MGSLTGARVVLEGAHAVSVGRERAHALAGVCQPALDRPVGAARVHVPVYQLRAGGGGRLAPDTAGQLRSPSKPLCVSGEGHVQVLVEKLDEPEMPLPGGPTRSPTLVPEVMLPTPHLPSLHSPAASGLRTFIFHPGRERTGATPLPLWAEPGKGVGAEQG